MPTRYIIVSSDLEDEVVKCKDEAAVEAHIQYYRDHPWLNRRGLVFEVYEVSLKEVKCLEPMTIEEIRYFRSTKSDS